MVKKKRSRSLMMVLLSIMVMVVFGASSVFASSNATKDAQAQAALRTYVKSKMTGSDYAVDGGGYLKGEDLFMDTKISGLDSCDLNEDQFSKLTSSAQAKAVQDIAQYSQNAVSSTDNSVAGVSESTVQNWWKQLQTKQGVGSKFMNQILQNTKPDFVTANQIYQPFSGVVGTVLGLIAVLLMAFLGIVMVSDIAYITLPPVRMFVADDEKGRFSKSKMFSHDALYAVKCAEEQSDGGSGNGKQALGIYFKRRIVMLILLGICLMYLVQGQLYTLVGYVLDLVSGFIGF